jgi:hypothetical protein
MYMSKGLNLLDILADALLEPEVDTSTVLIQANTAKLPTPEKAKVKKGKSDWKLAIALPDTQIGFRKYEDGTLDPFHDVHARAGFSISYRRRGECSISGTKISYVRY